MRVRPKVVVHALPPATAAQQVQDGTSRAWRYLDSELSKVALKAPGFVPTSKTENCALLRPDGRWQVHCTVLRATSLLRPPAGVPPADLKMLSEQQLLAHLSGTGVQAPAVSWTRQKRGVIRMVFSWIQEPGPLLPRPGHMNPFPRGFREEDPGTPANPKSPRIRIGASDRGDTQFGVRNMGLSFYDQRDDE